MDALTGVFCALGVLLLLFAIPLMVDVLPASVGGLLRTRELIHFENTMSLSRERDSLALLLLPLFFTALAYYRVFPSRLMAESPMPGVYGWTALFLTVYLLSRNLCLRVLGPKTDDQRARQVTARSFFTFYVLLCALMMLTYIALLPFHLPETRIAPIFRREIEAMYLLFLIRKGQIIFSYNSIGKTFWYIFTLELLPALVLASALIFI
ncbi:MAG: DUF4271 domain-containing protein [Bacteroidales bacterium]|nr:DUF4271 domain-containing protein [Bacteroidales bacterium]